MSTQTSKEDDLKTFFPDPVIVRIGDKEAKEVIDFEIKEFVFDNRLRFIKAMTAVFVDVSKKRPDIAGASDVEAILALIEIAGDRLLDVYSLVLERDAEWIKKNLTAKKEVEVLTAIFEVNEIPLLIGQIQRAIAGKKK